MARGRTIGGVATLEGRKASLGVCRGKVPRGRTD